MMKTRRFTPVRSAAVAFRADLAMRGSGETFAAHDGAWVALATLIQHAALVEAEHAEPLLTEAAALAESILERPSPSAQWSRLQSFLTIAREMEEAGAFQLTRTLLESLERADRSLSALDRGRVLAFTARVAWKLGDIERAQGIYRDVDRMGRTSGELELVARARVGYGTIAQLKGNYPAMRRFLRAAASLSRREGFREPERIAQVGLMIAAAMAKQFDEALVHGWRAYELSDTPRALADILANLGQLLLDAGHPEPSRVAFARVLAEQQPARLGLPALGGYALASAMLNDVTAVRWATREVRRQATQVSLPFQVASAMLDCATALQSLGDHPTSQTLRLSALEIANERRYHELQFRANTLAETAEKFIRREPSRLALEAQRVAREIEALDAAVPRLPAHVSFVAAN